VHHGALRRDVSVQHQRDAEHTLAADQADFESGHITGRYAQRDDAAGGKIDAVQRLPLRIQHVSDRQLNRFTVGHDPPPVRIWQCGEQTIVRGTG
jgi:hypothetical protein